MAGRRGEAYPFRPFSFTANSIAPRINWQGIFVFTVLVAYFIQLDNFELSRWAIRLERLFFCSVYWCHSLEPYFIRVRQPTRECYAEDEIK